MANKNGRKSGPVQSPDELVDIAERHMHGRGDVWTRLARACKVAGLPALPELEFLAWKASEDRFWEDELWAEEPLWQYDVLRRHFEDNLKELHPEFAPDEYGPAEWPPLPPRYQYRL